MNPTSQASKFAAFLCLLGLAFCAWVHMGRAEDACFTAGCQLYQETSLAGVSLWVVGMAAFGFLGLLSILGFTQLAAAFAFLGVFCDTFLLALLLFTAPCLFCLVFAFLLFAVLLVLRARLRRSAKSSAQSSPLSFSPFRVLVLCAWVFFFTCNVGVVLKAAVPAWAISENVEDASVHMYFSPSCTACRKGVEALSGSVDVAFYPVAESDWDIVRVARMREELARGENMFAALVASNAVERPGSLELWRPRMLLLRMRMLVNKAHVYLAGGGRVPYFEYRGLPSFLLEEAARAADLRREDLRGEGMRRDNMRRDDVRREAANQADSGSGAGPWPATRDHFDEGSGAFGSSVSGYCTGGATPCPDDEAEGFTRRQQ